LIYLFLIKMGQTFSNVIGSLIFLILKLSERAKQLISGEKKEKNYYNNDILLKDEEQHAGTWLIFTLFRYSFFRGD
jgi:hypothetical protein